MSIPCWTSSNPRRNWSTDEEQTLVQCLTGLVQMKVWQSDHGFRPSYLRVLKNQMACSYPESGVTENHIEGGLKLNTDGSWYDSNRNAGFGGLFRDEHGAWQLGYYGKMLAASSLEAEIWSIYRGLTIMMEKGLSNIQIESDSETAVNLFNEGATANHPQSNLLNDGKYLLNRTNSNLTHVSRGTNECADCLAHLGASQNEDLVVTSNPPLVVREFMIRDKLHLHHVLN